MDKEAARGGRSPEWFVGVLWFVVFILLIKFNLDPLCKKHVRDVGVAKSHAFCTSVKA